MSHTEKNLLADPPSSAPVSATSTDSLTLADLGRGDLASLLKPLRRELVESLWKNMVLVALVGVPASLSRAAFTGWLPLYSLHLLMGIGVVLIAMYRKRLSDRLLSAVFVGLLWAIGIPGVFSFGLASASTLWLVLSCFTASLLYSVRSGAIMAVLTFAALALFGTAFISGRMQLGFDAIRYNSELSGWANLIIATGSFAYMTLSAIASFYVSLARLTTTIKNQRDEIAVLAMHDELTGLPSLRLTDDRTLMAIHAARRSRLKVAVLFIDLDDFKQVNDTLGHAAGDLVLKEVATRLKNSVRAEDTVGRIGGDEFVVILANLPDAGRAGDVAHKIINALTQPMQHAGTPLKIGATIGISIFPDHGEDPQELRVQADHAMLAAKKSGKGTYACGNGSGISGRDNSPALRSAR